MITLYSQPSCGQCKMVHTLLNTKNIEFEECQDKDLMAEKKIEHTPAIEVDGKILTGKEMFNYINGACR